MVVRPVDDKIAIRGGSELAVKVWGDFNATEGSERWIAIHGESHALSNSLVCLFVGLLRVMWVPTILFLHSISVLSCTNVYAIMIAHSASRIPGQCQFVG